MMKNSNCQKNQSGLASIVIVTAIISILALLTIGFSGLMDREYHQATDRELASQAAYAAESGMNDARAYVVNQEKQGLDPTTPANGTKCLDLSGPSAPREFVPGGQVSGYYNNPAAPSDNTVKYTCVLINTHPKDLIYNPLHQNQSVVFKVATTVPVQTLYFSWQNYGDASNSQPLGDNSMPLPKETAVSSNQTGMLEVTLYPAVNTGGSSDAQNAAVSAASRTYFLYPNGGSGSPTFVDYYAGAGGKELGNCNLNSIATPPVPYNGGTGFYCNVGVSNLDRSGVPVAGFYYVRLTALYHDLNVGVQGADLLNNPLQLDNAQAVIDVTGEGNDILKRIDGRLELSINYNLPQYALQSMDTICKRQRLPKTGTPFTYAPSVIDDNNPDGACQPIF